MAEDKNKNITQETKIVMTIKQLVILIFSILSIFVGFYTMVIQPKFTDHEEAMQNITNKIDGGFMDVNDKLNNMSQDIGIIDGNIEGINNRFRDLNQQRANNGNTGGSFNPNN